MISNWQWRWCSVIQVPLTVGITRNVTSYLKMSVETRPTAASPRPPAESSVNCAQVSSTAQFISVKGFTWFICVVHQHPRYFNEKNNRTISPIICLSNIYEWMNELKFHYSRTSPHQASGHRNHRGDDGPHQGSSVRVRDGGPDRPSHHRGRLHGAQSGGVRTAVIRGRIHANQTSGVCCHDNK